MKPLYVGIAFAVGIVAIGILIVSSSVGGKQPHALPAANQAQPATTPTSGSSDGVASVASLVGGLEARLREQPDDGKGWLLLAKSYQHLGRLDDAREAYRKADALGQGDPTVAAQLFGLDGDTTDADMDD